MENEKNMTLWERIIGIYARPSLAMEELCRNPRILLPFLLLLLAQPLFYLLRYPAYLKFMEQMTGQSDPQVLGQLAVNGIIMRGASLVIAWVVSSLLMLGFTKIVGGQGTLKQLLSVNGYAYFAIIPMLIIMAIVGLFTGGLLINFSPAVFVPHLRGTVLYGVLRSFCAFFVWQHVLMGVGFYRVTKTSKAKSVVIVAVIFLIELFLNLPQLKIL